MRRRLLRLVEAVVAALVVNALILSVAYALGLWLGGHTDNLWLLLILPAPFVALLGLVAAALPEPVEKRTTRSAFGLVILGFALGSGYWYLVARTCGLGFLGLAVQAFASWSATGATTLLITLSHRSCRVLISVAVICFLAVVVPAPAFNRLAHNQELTVAFVVPAALNNASAYPKEIGFDSQSEVESTTSHVLQLIRASGMPREYRVVHLSRQGKGKNSLAVILVNASATNRTLLPEPDTAEVIYVQQPEGWAKKPADAPTLGRSIEISGHAERNDWSFAIPAASGIRLMGGIRMSETDH